MWDGGGEGGGTMVKLLGGQNLRWMPYSRHYFLCHISKPEIGRTLYISYGRRGKKGKCLC